MNKYRYTGEPAEPGSIALPRLGAFIGLAHGLVEIERIFLRSNL